MPSMNYVNTLFVIYVIYEKNERKIICKHTFCKNCLKYIQNWTYLQNGIAVAIEMHAC